MITMQEPARDSVVKDSDGYRWEWDDHNHGWTLRNFNHILAYVGLKWPVVERDYGPLTLEI